MNLYFATSNAHKIGEVSSILGMAGLPWRVLPASEAGGMPPVIEDGETFAANARKKALALRRRVLALDHTVGSQVTTSFLVAADDSGLCVDALNGAPGVRSARYAGEAATDDDNNAKLLRALAGVSEASRTAAFHCCIAVAFSTGNVRTFSGICPGRILLHPRGRSGFGYDPLFVPDGLQLSYAELSERQKNRISHRARALQQFIAWQAASP